MLPDTSPVMSIQRVESFGALLSTPFADGVNALCWSRSLPGDFAEVVRLLGPGEGVVALDQPGLESLALGAGGREAAGVMLADLRLLRDAGRDPVLNIVHGYPRDEDPGPVATDVFSFHADSAPVEADTWLCTYHGAASEGLLPHDALRKVDDPEIRRRLLALYGGPDDESFRSWLTENHYDLHYASRPEVTPYSFGIHNLWRITCAWPGSPVPPCVHRAPATNLPRLLLIS